MGVAATLDELNFAFYPPAGINDRAKNNVVNDNKPQDRSRREGDTGNGRA